MFRRLRSQFIQSTLTPHERDRVERALKNLTSTGFDPWGVSPETLKASLASTIWFYRKYFRVQTRGIENIPNGRCLLVANHSGQVPIDAMLIGTACLLEHEPPRLVRGMVERWAPSLPFVSTFFSRCGQVTGDNHNAKSLLESEECVLVFPEGTGGSGKTIFHRYELQKFGTGFVRLALEMKAPIVPVAVIGCEEMLPSLSRLQPLAKLLGMPYLPVLPTVVPIPTKVTLRFGEPILLEGNPNEPDREISQKAERVKTALRSEIEAGLIARGEKIFTGSGV